MNRREFLLSTIVASAAIATVPEAYSLANPDKYGLSEKVLRAYPHYKIVYDIGLAPAIEFARRARLLGLATTAIERDITDLWNLDLRLHWKKEPTWIAGVTSPASLFLLDQMAKDEKHCTLYQQDSGDGACLWVIGPRA